MRVRARTWIGLATVSGLAACVFPPSFDGYSKDTDAGALGVSGASGMGGSESGGTAGSGSTGGTGVGGEPSGGTGGSGGSGALGGSGGTGSAAAPGFGQRCGPDGICAGDLNCSPEFVLGNEPAAFAAAHVQSPSCVDICDDSVGTSCSSPSGEAGKCIGRSQTDEGLCVATCSVRTSLSCADGADCIHEFGQSGEGICTPPCGVDADCAWMGLPFCRPDGICDKVRTPTDDTDCSTSGCGCYPDPMAPVGTCKIPCSNNAQCPVHTATGRQMFCPHHPVMDSGGFGFCVVPCSTAGGSDECLSLGTMAVCVSDGIAQSACVLASLR